MKFFIRLFCVALVFLSSVAYSAAKFDVLPIKIEKFKLENGLEVIVMPNNRAPVVNHALWFKVGSADSPTNKSGIAHFLEHLMYKGTTKFPKDKYKKLINKYGGEHNAFTSLDVTMYYVTIAKEYLEKVMELEADRMQNLVLDDSIVAKERNVVLQERRESIESSPFSKVGEGANAAFFWQHPYGKPVIGFKEHIENYTTKDAIDFYKTWYTPNNAILVITGDVNLKEVKSLAKKYYSKIPGKQVPERNRSTEPSHNGVTYKVEMKDPQINSFVIQRIYRVPNYRTSNAKEVATLSLLARVLGDGSKGRLSKALVENQRLAHSASSNYTGRYLDPFSFTVTTEPVNAIQNTLVDATVESEIQRLIANGVTKSELDAIKESINYEFRYDNDSLTAISSFVGNSLAHGISIDDTLNILKNLDNVTLDDLQVAAKKYLKDGPEVVIYAYPISYN